MLTEFEQKELARLHQSELDFIYEVASKYNMSKADVQRLCFFTRISYHELQKHTLEPKNVHH